MGKINNFSIEEMYALLFRHILIISTKFAYSQIRECVVTIPAFYGYKERLAISQAIILSGIKLITIINENIGAATVYALEKRSLITENVIIYNMGNSFTQTSLVQFITQEVTNSNFNSTTSFKVIAESWDKEFGGINFSNNLYKYLIKKIDENPQRQGKSSVQNNKLIAERIFLEAVRAKEILSSKNEVNVEILDLDENINLQERITRDSFEKINSEDINKAFESISQVLNYSNLTINDIHKIEVIGGSVRIPAILNKLKGMIIEDKIVHDLNADESIAFGTAFIAANFSSAKIKTKPVPAYYGTNYEINIRIKHYEKANKTLCQNEINNTNNFSDYEIAGDCVRKINKSTTIFNVQQGFDRIKPITLRFDGDFDIEVYQKFYNSKIEDHIMTYRISDVDLSVRGMINEKVINAPPKITLKFSLDKKGLIDLKATINYNITLWLSIQQGLQVGGVEVVYQTKYVKPMNDEEFEKLMEEYKIENYKDSFVYKMRKDVIIKLKEDRKK